MKFLPHLPEMCCEHLVLVVELTRTWRSGSGLDEPPPPPGSPHPWATTVPPLRRREQGPVLGDGDRALEMRRQRTVQRRSGPAVRVNPHGRPPHVHHRLDRQASPSLRTGPDSGVPVIRTCGSSWSEVPMPWPTNSRTTSIPALPRCACTAAEMSESLAPARAAWMPCAATRASPAADHRLTGDAAYGTVTAASP